MTVYRQRVETVRRMPGLAAFWDFALREDGVGGTGRFAAYTASGDGHRYVLEPKNISREYWHEGREANLADFPLLGRGPFGQAVYFQKSADLSFLPVLEVPRAVLHDTPLDIKGPGKSVSMVVWLRYQGGDHAIAGIWHEGTTTGKDTGARVRQTGRRQYGMFAGLAANPGAVAAHVSENGTNSFGNIYARHLAVTPDKMKVEKREESPEASDAGWSVAGFVFDAERKSVTAYLNGVAAENWIEAPGKNGFYRFAERAWKQARQARLPGQQPGEDPSFPGDQFYEPPEGVPLREEVLTESPDERVVLRSYEYTRVRLALRRDGTGAFAETGEAELVALRVNPYWFGHSIYAPKTADEGGPFTIGRVIHSGRKGAMTAHIGGVAVYGRALAPREMRELAHIGRETESPESPLTLIRSAEISEAPR